MVGVRGNGKIRAKENEKCLQNFSRRSWRSLGRPKLEEGIILKREFQHVD
jgi:hypothetical protein